jgi:hypothetical protein
MPDLEKEASGGQWKRNNGQVKAKQTEATINIEKL